MENTTMAPIEEQENSVMSTTAQEILADPSDGHHPVLFWIATGFLCLSGIGAVIFFVLWKKSKKREQQAKEALAAATQTTAPAAQPAPAPVQEPNVEAPAQQPNQA